MAGPLNCILTSGLEERGFRTIGAGEHDRAEKAVEPGGKSGRVSIPFTEAVRSQIDPLTPGPYRR